MQLLIVRHADAGEAGDFAKTGRPDEDRPLSPRGREQMAGVVKGLRALVPSCDAIVSSPYMRAVQTADYLAEAYGMEVMLDGSLVPEAPVEEIERSLRDQPQWDVVIVTGHEPHLGNLIAWLIVGESDAFVELKKAGACLLEFDGKVRKGAGRMRWLMRARDLIALSSAPF